MFLEIQVTFKDQIEAEKVINSLLQKRLIACANFSPVNSWYWWKNKIEKDEEVLAVLKTSEDNWPYIREEIQKLHSYDIPAIVKLEVESNDDYDAWINSESQKTKIS